MIKRLNIYPMKEDKDTEKNTVKTYYYKISTK
jgi:hypothetical protein